jgi:hypothetical protein
VHNCHDVDFPSSFYSQSLSDLLYKSFEFGPGFLPTFLEPGTDAASSYLPGFAQKPFCKLSRFLFILACCFRLQRLFQAPSLIPRLPAALPPFLHPAYSGTFLLPARFWATLVLGRIADKSNDCVLPSDTNPPDRSKIEFDAVPFYRTFDCSRLQSIVGCRGRII